MMKIKNEKIWLTQITSAKTYIITSTNLRDMYYLYEVIDGKPVKTKYKNANPTELNKYMKN